MYEVLTLKPPWAGIRIAHEIWMRVQQGEHPRLTAADEAGAPQGYVALLREMWALEPVERPTFVEALKRLRAMKAVPILPPRNGGGYGTLDLVSDLFDKKK